MKSEVKQLLRDLNVAIQLGRPEAIDIALRSLLRFPGVAGNEHMDTQFVDQVVLPIGQSLSALPSNILRPLLSHSLVVGRAIGAVSIAHRFFVGSPSLNPSQAQPNAPISIPLTCLRKSSLARVRSMRLPSVTTCNRGVSSIGTEFNHPRRLSSIEKP